MKTYLTIILIGMVSGFIGIIPLLRKKADKYMVLAGFVLFLLMPYVVFRLSPSLDSMVVEGHGGFSGSVFAADYSFRARKFALRFSIVNHVGCGRLVYLFLRAFPVVM